VTGGSREFHNEALHNLYSSPNIIRMMRRVGHVTLMGEIINAYKIWLESLKDKHYLEDLRLYERIILK
jgi:hypothetical protein